MVILCQGEDMTINREQRSSLMDRLVIEVICRIEQTIAKVYQGAHVLNCINS